MKLVKPALDPGTTEYGGVVKISITDKDSPLFCAGVFILKPGESLPMESHKTDEMFYVITGTLSVTNSDKGESYTVSAGEIFLISAGEMHLSENNTGSDVEVFWTNGG